MSTSLHRNMCFFFPESVAENIFIKDKIKNLYEDEVELSAPVFLEKLNNEINACILNGSLTKAELTDILYSMTDGFQKKSENKSLSDYVKTEYQYDNYVGVAFQTSWDESVSRYKHNIDWYRLVDENEFIQEPVIGSLHAGNSCLVKRYGDSLNVVYEEDLIDAYLKAINHPLANDSERSDMFYRSKAKKALGELMNRDEFYAEMKKLGYSEYINPAYYLTAKIGGLLNPEVTREVFEAIKSFFIENKKYSADSGVFLKVYIFQVMSALTLGNKEKNLELFDRCFNEIVPIFDRLYQKHLSLEFSKVIERGESANSLPFGIKFVENFSESELSSFEADLRIMSDESEVYVCKPLNADLSELFFFNGSWTDDLRARISQKFKKINVANLITTK